MSKIELPMRGASRDEILSRMGSMRGADADWRGARMFGLVYRADDDIMELCREAYGRFIAENGLSPFAFPSLRRFETEVVAMVASMLHGDDEVVGSMTSGGSESILMAVKAARDHARATRPDVTAPELLAPVTAHPAWDKSAHYLGLKVVHVPVRDDYRADPKAMAAACTPRTIMMVASAPTYPHGVVDPIGELSDIALERGLWLHVDACLGGFVLPFAGSAGYPIPPFDFELPGVTSISADVHKYGFAAKGASTVLYRDASYRRHQLYVHADWPGGVYGTPTMLGARPGGAVAAAWAVMNYLGQDGYTRIVRSMMQTTRRLIDGVRTIPGLSVLGDPDMTIFAIGSPSINVFALADDLRERGWYLETQQLPASLHVTVSPGHADIVEPFLRDLASAVERVRGLPEVDLSGTAAMYGMIGSLPDRGAAREIALQALDSLYRVDVAESPRGPGAPREDAGAAALRREDELLAILGHELRGPLTPIVSALNLMKVKNDAGVTKERELIERQVAHLSRLIDGLLDVSRIRHGKIALTLEPVELHAVVAKAIEIVVPLLGRHGHGLEIAVPGSGLLVQADPSRLVQVVSNLITNAAKYTDPGGHISVSAAREGDRVVLRVKDDGIGIRPELLPQLFSPFVQGERTVGRSDGGLGIGLMLVRSLVELHGGTVSVASEGEGRGSEFVIRLPVPEEALAQP